MLTHRRHRITIGINKAHSPLIPQAAPTADRRLSLFAHLP